MSNLRNKLLDAYQANNFFDAIFTSSLGSSNNFDEVAKELIAINNDGIIDLVHELNKLQYREDIATNFIQIQLIIQKALPYFVAPVKKVMDCLLHLFTESQPTRLAGKIIDCFFDFCMGNYPRAREALSQIDQQPHQYSNFLCPALVAGSDADITSFFESTIRLTSHPLIDIKKGAVFSLGKLHYPKESSFPKLAINHLKLLISQEYDNDLLKTLILAVFDISLRYPEMTEECIIILQQVLPKSGDEGIAILFDFFSLNSNETSSLMLKFLMENLLITPLNNEQKVTMLDRGVYTLLKHHNHECVIKFLEDLLMCNKGKLNIAHLKLTANEIANINKPLLEKLITRWFQKNDCFLHIGIHNIIKIMQNTDILMTIEEGELVRNDSNLLLHLAHKVIGYLFRFPYISASLLLSLIKLATDEATRLKLNHFLFENLILNYPNKLKNFLLSQTNNSSQQIKMLLQRNLDNLSNYFSTLNSLGYIPELIPSSKQQQENICYLNKNIAKSFNEALKNSIVNLTTSSLILYGRKSINYFPIGDRSRRFEILLQNHTVVEEVPRQYIDPIGLAYKHFNFRIEKLEHK